MDKYTVADNQQIKISEQLKSYFNDLDITQQQIADKLGITQSAVGALLNGKPFGKKTAARWGELFGIQPSWLLTGHGNMLTEMQTAQPTQYNSETISIPTAIWNVISNQALSLTEKDKQISEAMKQTSDVIEILKEQLKKNQIAEKRSPAACLVEEDDA